jgi:DNA mismatch endonuclease, patch repair protein
MAVVLSLLDCYEPHHYARVAREVWVSRQAGRHVVGGRKVDTAPEVLLRRELHRAGGRYLLHWPLAPRCTPDLALVRRRVAVFVDGCWWHSCPLHGPKTPLTGPNAQPWEAIMERVRERDSEATAIAQELGWTVVRLRECNIMKDPRAAARLVLAAR